jgi:hypothetical protein
MLSERRAVERKLTERSAFRGVSSSWIPPAYWTRVRGDMEPTRGKSSPGGGSKRRGPGAGPACRDGDWTKGQYAAFLLGC